MNADPLALGREAFEAVRCLVEAGPRPAGSAAERRALDWIRAQMAELGFTTRVDEFSFPRLPAFCPYYAVPGLGFLVCALLLPVFPWPALGLPLLVATLPDLHEWFMRRLPQTGRSANLLALPPGLSLDRVEVLFAAHVDTARAIPAGGRSLQRLRLQVFDGMQRLAVILALLGIVYGVGAPVGAAVSHAAVTLGAFAALVLLGLDLYDQLGTRGKYTVGANDNASGVAALLTAARKLAAQDPENARAGFLFTGAEEPGLYGARHFAGVLRESGAHPRIVSVDMVGCGDRLRIIAGTKSLRLTKTTAEVNALLERADHTAAPHTALRRSGDFLPFLQAGFPAGALEANGTPDSWRAYHTLDDRLYLLEPEMLGQAVFTLLRSVELG